MYNVGFFLPTYTTRQKSNKKISPAACEKSRPVETPEAFKFHTKAFGGKQRAERLSAENRGLTLLVHLETR